MSEDKETALKNLRTISTGKEKVYIVVNGSLEFKHSELVKEFIADYD
jgi:hypothetical protein